MDINKEFENIMNNMGVRITDVESNLNWYLINKQSSSLFTEGNLVRGKNSKQALEKYIRNKVKRSLEYYEPFDYCVSLSNEKGQVYRDRRKTIYYKVI